MARSYRKWAKAPRDYPPIAPIMDADPIFKGTPDAPPLRQPHLRQRLQAAPAARPSGPGLRAHRGGYRQGGLPHAGLPGEEPQRAHSGAGARGRDLPRGVERHPVLSGGGLALPPFGPAGARADPAMDVLRAIQPRALYRGRPPLASSRRADGPAARAASGKTGGRPRRARRDGRPSGPGGLVRRQGHDHRRHRALCLYPCGRGRGFDLGACPGVRAWLDRVAAEPGHVPMAVEGLS